MTTLDEALGQINKLVGFNTLDDDPDLLWIHHKYHVKPSFVALGLCMLLAILLLLSRADRLIVCFTCSIIPAYFTFLALLHMRKPLIVKYLTYWAMFVLMELVSPIIVLVLPAHFWVFIRVVLTVSLLNPKLNGAGLLYTRFIKPFMDDFEPSMQQETQLARNLASNPTVH